jgi:MFS superfamily sulfate permease-like transporter
MAVSPRGRSHSRYGADVTIAAITWHDDWAWSLPLIVLTVVIHVLGLGLINDRVVRVLSHAMDRRHFTALFVIVIGTTALLVTILHRVEGAIWGSRHRAESGFTLSETNRERLRGGG